METNFKFFICINLNIFQFKETNIPNLKFIRRRFDFTLVILAIYGVSL